MNLISLGTCHWWWASEVFRKESTPKGNSDADGGVLEGNSRRQTNGTSIDSEAAGHIS